MIDLERVLPERSSDSFSAERGSAGGRLFLTLDIVNACKLYFQQGNVFIFKYILLLLPQKIVVLLSG